MNSVKLNKRHLLTFSLVIVLLFSLNLNVFASTWSPVVDFSEQSYKATVADGDGNRVDFTNSVVRLKSGEYTGFYFVTKADYRSWNKILYTGADLPLTPGNAYNYSLSFYTSDDSPYSISICAIVRNIDTDDTTQFYLLDETYVDGKEVQSFNGRINFSTDYSAYEITFVIVVVQNGNIDLSKNFVLYLSDMVFEWDSPLAGSHYDGNEIPSGNIDLDEYEKIENELPTIDSNDISDIADLIDNEISGYRKGMEFFRYLWERTMEVFNFNSILVISLGLGLALYIIGRKVGGL